MDLAQRAPRPEALILPSPIVAQGFWALRPHVKGTYGCLGNLGSLSNLMAAEAKAEAKRSPTHRTGVEWRLIRLQIYHVEVYLRCLIPWLCYGIWDHHIGKY